MEQYTKMIEYFFTGGEKKSRILRIVALVVSIILVHSITSALWNTYLDFSMPIIFPLIIDFVVICIFAVYGFIIYGKKEAQDISEKLAINKQHFTYDEATRTVNLIKRGMPIKDAFDIVEVYNFKVKHEELKLHVGAVSVGGVTTGGAYTTGGNNVITDFSKAGVYKLEYFGQSVVHIQLNRDDFEKAMQSPIARFLNQSTRQIDVEKPVSYTAQETQAMINNFYSTGYVGNDSRCYRAYGEIAEIIRWLSSPERTN